MLRQREVGEKKGQKQNEFRHIGRDFLVETNQRLQKGTRNGLIHVTVD